MVVKEQAVQTLRKRIHLEEAFHKRRRKAPGAVGDGCVAS